MKHSKCVEATNGEQESWRWRRMKVVLVGYWRHLSRAARKSGARAVTTNFSLRHESFTHRETTFATVEYCQNSGMLKF